MQVAWKICHSSQERKQWVNYLHLLWQIASVNWFSNGSENGLSPVPLQAITWSNGESLSIVHLGTNFREFLISIKNIDENAFENAVCKNILPRGDESKCNFDGPIPWSSSVILFDVHSAIRQKFTLWNIRSSSRVMQLIKPQSNNIFARFEVRVICGQP